MTTRQILTTFGAAVLRARDQRGVWRPREKCIAALMREHRDLSMAYRLTTATERVAEHIRTRCLPPLSSSLLEGSGLGPGVH